MKGTKHAVSALFALTGLAACAPAAVKDITADEVGYLEQNFSPKYLPASVAQQIKGAPAARGFDTLTFTSSAVFKSSGKPDDKPTLRITLKNAGNGELEGMTEYANNGIPYGITYSLSYLGLVPLRLQRVYLARTMANQVIEAKQLLEITKEPIAPGGHYIFEWTSGLAPQLANFSTVKLQCTAGNAYPASRLYAGLPGQAVDLHCERFLNEVLRAKQTFAVLQQYGVALETEHQTSSTSETYTLTGFEAQ